MPPPDAPLSHAPTQAPTHASSAPTLTTTADPLGPPAPIAQPETLGPPSPGPATTTHAHPITVGTVHIALARDPHLRIELPIVWPAPLASEAAPPAAAHTPARALESIQSGHVSLGQAPDASDVGTPSQPAPAPAREFAPEPVPVADRPPPLRMDAFAIHAADHTEATDAPAAVQTSDGEPSGSSLLSPSTFAGLAIVVAVIVTMRAIRKRARSISAAGGMLSRVDVQQAAAQSRAQRADAAQVCENLETTRRLAATIDSKSALLHALLARGTPGAPASAQARLAPSSLPPPERSHVSPLIEAKRAPSQAPITVPATTSVAAPSTAQQIPANHRSNHDVLMLAGLGLSAAAIARKLGREIGQVELVLALGSRSTAHAESSAGSSDSRPAT